MSKQNAIRRSIERTVPGHHSKTALCPRCEMPMKRLPTVLGGEEFLFCSPCDSWRNPLVDEDDLEVAMTAHGQDILNVQDL
jgi:hypothetical protein